MKQTVKKDKRRPDKFPLQSKNFFLTFPQCDKTKEDALEALQKNYTDDLEYAIVSHENHEPKEGDENIGNHLHVMFGTLRRHNYKSHTCFNFVGGKQGNYQTVENMFECTKYVIKDGDYVYHGRNPEAYINATEKHAPRKSGFPQVIDMITKENKDLEYIKITDPVSYARDSKKIKEFYLDWKNKAIEYPPYVPIKTNYPFIDAILNIHFSTEKPHQRKEREKNLWISGPTECGKSSIIRYLKQYIPIFMINDDESFIELWQDGKYKATVLDEYEGGKTMGFLNKWCSGAPTPVKVKCSAGMKNDNIITIIISNKKFEEVYHNAKQDNPQVFEACKNRFYHVEVTMEDKLTIEGFDYGKSDIEKMLDKLYEKEQKKRKRENTSPKYLPQYPSSPPQWTQPQYQKEKDKGPKKPENYKDLPLIEKLLYKDARKEWNAVHNPKKVKSSKVHTIDELYPEINN